MNIRRQAIIHWGGLVIPAGIASLIGATLFLAPVQGSEIGSVVATVTVTPLSVTVQATPPAPFLEQQFKARATVENSGSSTLDDVTVEIFLPAGLELLSEKVQTLGTLAGGRQRKASWDIRPHEVGNHILVVLASAVERGAGAPVENEGATIVEVRNPPNGLAGIFRFLLGIFR